MPEGFVKQVKASGPKAFVQAIVYRRNDVPAQVLDDLSGIKGARAISDRLPLAPTKDFAGAILGTVGPATAELVKDSDGRIQAGDDVGISGLQKRYDEQLFGTRGATVVAVDEKGERRTLFTADPTPGKPLRTTIDPAIQQTAQQVLADVRLGQCTRRDPALDRRPRRRGERARLEGLQHRDLRPLRTGVDLQGGQHPRAPPRGRHTPDRGALPGHDRGRRQELQELRRLPGLRPRRDHLRGRARQLVQHGVHLPARQARPGSRWSRPRPRWGSGSTTTSASRRTSARWARPGARPRPRRA